jgi:hypothetical protein
MDGPDAKAAEYYIKTKSHWHFDLAWISHGCT